RPSRDRKADQARVDRGEARPARVVPPGPDGLADPRHGRRAHPDREGRGGGRGRRAGRARAAPPSRRVHVRRLPRQLQDAPQDGTAQGRPLDDPGPGQAAPGPGRRRARAGPRRGDHPVDDAARARAAAPDRRLAPTADRTRERHHRPGGLAPPERPQGDAEADETHGTGQDAGASRPDRQALERRHMAVRMRLTRVGSKKNPIYRVVVADSRSPRDGKFIEIVGRYNPQTDPSVIELDEAKVKDWLAKGAQPSDAVSRLLKAKDLA